MASSSSRVSLGPPPQSIADHVVRTLKLGVPVIIMRCGMLLMMTVDTIMTGRAGGNELAYLAIGFAPHITMMVIGFGLLAGCVILVAQADGAGRREDCGNILWTAMLNGTALGLIWAVFLFNGEAILWLFGQEADLARGGGEVMAMYAWGMPGVFLFTSCSMFLEGIGRTKPGMVVMIIANFANIFLNWVLIYGNLGFEAGGASGAVLATSLTRWLMFGCIVVYILSMADKHAYGLFRPLRRFGQLERRFLRLGTPMGLSYAFETSAFMFVTMMAGHLGAPQVAAFQAAMNVNAFCFMVAIGMSTATAVRVGNAVGRRDREAMATAGWVGTGLIFLLMLPLAAVVALIPESLAAIYTEDPVIIAIIVTGLFVAAFLIAFDGLQAVLVGALRGAADVWPATWLGLMSFWGVMLPLAWFLGHRLELGVPGLMWGIVGGIALATLLLAWRFRVVSLRDVKPFT